MRGLRLLAEFYSQPWALLPSVHASIEAVLLRWAEGVRLSADDIGEAIGARAEVQAARRARMGSIAAGTGVVVLPVHGVIGHRAHLVADSSSGVGASAEILATQLRAARVDPQVGAAVLDLDTPGGSVSGIAEAAAEVAQFAAVKPIVAVANSMAASAGYWLASQATEIVVTPSGEVGSIGVVAAHDNISAALEQRGIKRELLFAGKYKVEGNMLGPLTDEARGFLQGRIDQYYDAFTRAVAAGRRDSLTAVREGYGQGRMLGADEAVKAKLADRVGTLEQVLDDLTRRTAPARGASGKRASATSIEHLRLALLEAERPA